MILEFIIKIFFYIRIPAVLVPVLLLIIQILTCMKNIYAILRTLLFSLLVFTTHHGISQAGTLDPFFGNNGSVSTNMKSDWDDQANALGIQSDGKIIVAGTSNNQKFTHHDMSLLRYNNNGSLDSTFGDNGKRIPNLPSDWSSFHRL